MNQNNRICSQQGHEQSEVYHICTYRWCNKSRWCCSLCLNDKIHDHQISKNHIMNQAELSVKVKQDIGNLRNAYLNSEQVVLIEKKLNYLVRQTQGLEQNIVGQNVERKLYSIISDDDNFKLQSLLGLVEGQNFFNLNDEDINKLLNINYYQFDNNVQIQFQDKLDQQQQNLLQEILKDFKEKLIKRNCDIQKIKVIRERKFNFLIQSSAITKNEQYLVYSVDNIIYLYDIIMKKIQSKIVQQNEITQFQFTNDSKCIFAGDKCGFVYGYFVLKGFKRFYKQQIHKLNIFQIIIQKQYLITAAYDNKIIKTDFIKKTQIFKLVGHTDAIYSIAYDIQKDIIISTSKDKSIKIWDCLNQGILIDHQNDTIYTQIQLINNNQDIICNNYRKLRKFTIDYQNKKLVQYRLYKDENRFQTLEFQQVNNDQILVISEHYTKIFNNQMELTHHFQHSERLSQYQSICYMQQLDNLNYIILQDYNSICLLRVKN